MTNAIETAAYGRLFRSRLEARFAVLFTRLNLEWQYEPEGYKLPSGYYLPDFLVNFSDQKFWIEIKQFKPNGIEKQKAQQLANLTRTGVCICTYQDLVDWANNKDPSISIAAAAALSQRFEHGESPAWRTVIDGSECLTSKPHENKRTRRHRPRTNPKLLDYRDYL